MHNKYLLDILKVHFILKFIIIKSNLYFATSYQIILKGFLNKIKDQLIPYHYDHHKNLI